MTAPQLPVFLELTTDHGFELLQQAHGNIYQWYEVVGKGPIRFGRFQDRADRDLIVKILSPPYPRRFTLLTVMAHLGEPPTDTEADFLVVARRLEAGGLALLDGLESQFHIMDWGGA
jgi:hypothetical protein